MESNQTVVYHYGVVKAYIFTALALFVLGGLAGLYAAAELAWPSLNAGIAEISFGRMRVIHTLVIIYGFAGSALMGTGYYVVQRTCGVRLWSSRLAWWQYGLWITCLVGVLLTVPFGMTQSKEYAEPEWFLDIIIAVSWLLYTFVFVMTISSRDKTTHNHIYVANWFYLAMMVMITYLHVVNNLSIPVSWTKSYSIFSGVQDAMIQWWWGHNAVGFLLTAGFLGMMYYFVPKQARAPVYSYRLSVLHFWTLIFGYVWVGTHHLHYTSLPDWTATLGAAISIGLIIPSWGGAVNATLTIMQVKERLSSDYVLRFLLASVLFYGLATFEGPLMSIKTVNQLSHYTDWTVGHVHSGALGWVAMVTFGSLYYLIMQFWGNGRMYSNRLIAAHFWLSIVGTIIYMIAMWISGVDQGLMWQAFNENGQLKYSFLESVIAVKPWYVMRAAGGMLFWIGALLMCYNTWKTVRSYETENIPQLQRA